MISVLNISKCTGPGGGVSILALHARHFISLLLAAFTCMCCNMCTPGVGGGGGAVDVGFLVYVKYPAP